MRWRQVLWDALTVHVHVAEETAEVARKAERAAQLAGPAGTAAAMAAARAAATTPVLERLSGSVQLVLERAWGAMHHLAAEVEVELWDALCTPLSGDTFAAMVSLVVSLQTCFITTPAEQAAMQAAARQAGPRSPAHVGVVHSPSLAQPVTLCRIKLANMLLRIREADAFQYELLLQGVTLWTVQVQNARLLVDERGWLSLHTPLEREAYPCTPVVNVFTRWVQALNPWPARKGFGGRDPLQPEPVRGH